MKNKLITTTLCLFAVVTVYAQHEFSINAFGGMQPINFSITGGTTSGAIDFGGGIGYNYNFSKEWSIGTGADFSFYNASLEMKQYNLEVNTPNYDLTINATGYKEDISALLLEIPLTARYTLPIEENSLQFTGGFKFGFPFSAKYTASADRLQTSGHFLLEDQTYRNVDDVFINEALTDQYDKWDAKMSIMLTIEAAYRFAIGEKYGFAVGVYFNYGFNDMQGSKDKYPVNIAGLNADVTKAIYTYNSMLDTERASSIRPMAVGLKLRFDLGL